MNIISFPLIRTSRKLCQNSCADIGRFLPTPSFILHAGDLARLAVLDWLEEIAPVLAARGNGGQWLGRSPRRA